MSRYSNSPVEEKKVYDLWQLLGTESADAVAELLNAFVKGAEMSSTSGKPCAYRTTDNAVRATKSTLVVLLKV